MKIERSMAWWLEKARQEGNSAKEDEMPGTGQYSTHDCGGPDVCSGCSSWRHGVHDDGSGSPEAVSYTHLDVYKRQRVLYPSV